MASETESQAGEGDIENGSADDSFEGVTPDAARRLLLGAVEAFGERGFHATTTRDIASRAGMSPAALYIHYKTKEELLYQISRFGHERSVRILADAVATGADENRTPGATGVTGAAGPTGATGEGAAAGSDASARLARAVRSFVRWHAEHHTTARVVQYELSALGEEHYAEIVGLRRKSDELLRGVLDEGAASGEFAVTDIRGTALAVMSLCIDVARWFNPAGVRTPDEIGALYADLVLRMVGSAVPAPGPAASVASGAGAPGPGTTGPGAPDAYQK